MPTIITIAVGIAFEILKHKTNDESTKKMLSIFATLVWIASGLLFIGTGGIKWLFLF